MGGIVLTKVRVMDVRPSVCQDKGGGLYQGVSRAPNLKGTKESLVCTIDGCTREYFSSNGLRYHLKEHHTEEERCSGCLASTAARGRGCCGFVVGYVPWNVVEHHLNT